jgi:hypothetical protein
MHASARANPHLHTYVYAHMPLYPYAHGPTHRHVHTHAYSHSSMQVHSMYTHTPPPQPALPFTPPSGVDDRCLAQCRVGTYLEVSVDDPHLVTVKNSLQDLLDAVTVANSRQFSASGPGVARGWRAARGTGRAAVLLRRQRQSHQSDFWEVILWFQVRPSPGSG